MTRFYYYFLARLEDARGDKLVDFGAHDGVAHGLVASGLGLRVVGAQVLDHLPHHGVRQNGL